MATIGTFTKNVDGTFSVTLDDHSLSGPIYANLVETDEDYSLIWSRSRSTD
ncbi:DUF736 family protein [Phenylobacterium sp.]|jgi:uncharacterized protein (DUF736 family)|uniref:DUF736 family protein n=1 Tax=Phenylobacterium sp. TaxID=1871053 RepID=UPI002E33AF9B|nr:DUF736 family protein [Phenylobacterium sp.]HEX3367654.1 DUF736 family protein [Phenylobacterium sp.]